MVGSVGFESLPESFFVVAVLEADLPLGAGRIDVEAAAARPSPNSTHSYAAAVSGTRKSAFGGRSIHAIALNQMREFSQADQTQGSCYFTLMADVHLPPDVEARVAAIAHDTRRNLQEVVEDLLRRALQTPEYLTREAKQAFDRELKRRVDSHLAGGPVVTYEEMLARLGLDADE